MSDQHIKITDRIELRPVVVPDDEDFLKDLYHTTRYDLEQLPFDEAGKRAFSLMQYTAQKNHYTEHYANASHDIVLFDAKPAGRFMIDRRADEIVGVDLSLLPGYRSLGIGSELINSVLKEAKNTDRPFVFHVQKDNHRAVELYKRLGCRFIGSTFDTHFRMEWRGESNASEDVPASA